jgi:Autotransporter beta-domain
VTSVATSVPTPPGAASGRSELGARFDSRLSVSDNSILLLRGRIAWAHEFSGNPSLDAAFATLPGTAFTVTGAGLPRDALLVSAGPELRLPTVGACASSSTASSSASPKPTPAPVRSVSHNGHCGRLAPPRDSKSARPGKMPHRASRKHAARPATPTGHGQTDSGHVVQKS